MGIRNFNCLSLSSIFLAIKQQETKPITHIYQDELQIIITKKSNRKLQLHRAIDQSTAEKKYFNIPTSTNNNKRKKKSLYAIKQPENLKHLQNKAKKTQESKESMINIIHIKR